MECPACGPTEDHDLLFSCNQCNRSLCQKHYQQHSHGSAQGRQGGPSGSGSQYAPMGRFTLDLSQLADFARRAGMQQEPSDEDYERYLRSNPKVLTTGRESLDLMAGIALIAFVFGFQPILSGTRSWQFVVVLTAIISPAFILHELAHKYLAIYYGKYARFTMLRQMAFFTFLAGVLGIPLAGPGATMILGQSTEKENGIFSAGGPFVNFVLAGISFILAIVVPQSLFIQGVNMSVASIFYLSAFINAVLGVFNLIPFGGLDGKKILSWNKLVWVELVLLNLPMAILSYQFITL